MVLSMIDPGVYHSPTYRGPEVSDIREWVEIFRRLFVPYYEEARLYWQQALAENYFDSFNEVYIYQPETLRRLIERFEEHNT